MSKIPAIVCWSGGKDCSMALHQIQLQRQYEVRYLLSTMHTSTGRLGMHGLRPEVLEAQAAAIGLPLQMVWVGDSTNAAYEKAMMAAFRSAKNDGIEAVIFGDIFLQDLKAYRDKMLADCGLTGVYPLWQKDTNALMNSFLQEGFRAKICCINQTILPEALAGAELDAAFVKALPATADPCGENGEFHTVCYDGPIFNQTLLLQRGEQQKSDLPLNNQGEMMQFVYTDWRLQPPTW